MGAKVKEYFAKAKAALKKLNKKVRTIIAVVLVATVIALAALVIYNRTRPYAVLFTELSSSDMSAVLSYLDSSGEKDYKVQGTDTILVRENRVNALQAKVLQQGYPTSGYLYDTYTEMTGTLASDADRVQASVYQAQERLGAMLSSFDGVAKASVNISLGEDNRYILSTEDKIEASAFVFVEMEQGRTLTAQQVKMMKSGVAHSVQGLTIDNVAVTDALGTVYDDDDELSDATTASALKLSLEQDVNNSVRNSVLTILSPIFGLENLSVSVRSTVDISRSYVESTEYSQPDWASEGVDGTTGSQGIIGSLVYDDTITRDEDSTVGGVAGTTTNSDLHEYITDPDNLTGDEDEIHSYVEKDFENDQTITQSEIPAGRVTDVMVAVAIDSAKVTVPDTLDLVTLVGRAAGISVELQEEKITIMAYPFYEEGQTVSPVTPQEPVVWPFGLETWMVMAIAVGVVLLLLLIIILCIRHSIKKRKKRKQQESKDREDALRRQQEAMAAAILAGEKAEQATQGADIMDIHTERSMELRKDVRQFAEDNPEIAAQMVKSWLKGGDEQHG